MMSHENNEVGENANVNLHLNACGDGSYAPQPVRSSVRVVHKSPAAGTSTMILFTRSR